MTVQSLPIGGWNDLPPELWCDVINRIDSGYHGVIACVSRSLHANVRDCEQSRKCGRTSVPHSSQPRTYVRRNVLSMKSASSRRLPIRVSLICRYGGSVMLSWARAAGCPWNARLAASLATLGGAAAIRMLRWAREENMPPCPWDSEVCNIAAEAGDIELLSWAYENGCPWGPDTAIAAARKGQLETLKWLRQHGCPWSDSAAPAGQRAAAGGHLAVLQWLTTEGFTCDKNTAATAAAGGHLEVLKWLRNSLNCEWGKETTVAAARGGHLELLKWARAHGCPWDGSACEAAASGGHLHILQFLNESGCPCDWRAQAAAAQAGHNDVLKWIRLHSL
uniref:F-box domain-containing protein n=1 Tax=Tetraselmis sp. GSL018 TaxID=582737 RepID=A0A061R459_9CHLO|mmetsp:Transcript_20459/g.48715  ORF Transcript_20459/g.48715 Transcript_20459/m.48715 type:complete len:335 (-) Transcript_20459:523-1527(-)